MRKLVALAFLGAISSVALADVNVTGGVGYRNQATEVGAAAKNSVDRYAAELVVSSKINDNVNAVVGVRTGSFNSAYTDFGNNANLDSIGVNLAYVDYNVLDNLKLTLGKMNQPWATASTFLFDRDVKPTGFAASYKNTLGLFANLSQVTVADGGVADARVHNIQLGYTKKLMGVDLTGAVGQYDYANVGAQKYKIDQVFVSAGTKVAGFPVSAFVETLSNSEATSANNNARAVGIKVGNAVNPHQWDIAIADQKVEANAQYGLWNDSDFAGGQGNYEGKAYTANYVVAKGWVVRAKYFDSTRGTNKEAYKRTQIDLAYKF